VDGTRGALIIGLAISYYICWRYDGISKGPTARAKVWHTQHTCFEEKHDHGSSAACLRIKLKVGSYHIRLVVFIGLFISVTGISSRDPHFLYNSSATLVRHSQAKNVFRLMLNTFKKLL